jgi:hypothetical protein
MFRENFPSYMIMPPASSSLVLTFFQPPSSFIFHLSSILFPSLEVHPFRYVKVNPLRGAFALAEKWEGKKETLKVENLKPWWRRMLG